MQRVQRIPMTIVFAAIVAALLPVFPVVVCATLLVLVEPLIREECVLLTVDVAPPRERRALLAVRPLRAPPALLA